jgi:hypothetical protein
MNMVEGFIRDLTVDSVRHGSRENVRELTYAITEYLAERNLKPNPYQ